MALVLIAFALAASGCGAEEGDTPPASPPAAAQPIPGGGLTIEEALETDAEPPLAVRGSLVATAEETRLCSALAESYPPQCAGPSLRVEGLDLAEVEGLLAANGVRWTDGEVSLLGAVDDGVLTVSRTAK